MPHRSALRPRTRYAHDEGGRRPEPPIRTTDRISIIANAASLSQFCEARASELDYPIEQLRAGRPIPPSILVDLLDGQRQLYRRVGAHAVLIATLIAEAPERPPPWWRRWWRRIRGGRTVDRMRL